jgi:PIN domain nuclease of toxin-antitoxin system
MRLLLDTHTFIWFVTDSPRLSTTAKAFIEDEYNEKLLSIQIDHLNVVANLSLHHRDPFDRLIIAQAMAEQIPVVGTDAVFDSYSIQRLW